MGIELDAHQIEAINQLKNGNILCGQVGSGKSRCALTYYFCRECQGSIRINGKGRYSKMKKPRDLYIITTAHKRDTHEWEGECIPFLLDKTVKVDSWNNIKKYVNVRDAFFIFDEQRVIGYGTWARSFIKIAHKNRWILLSATPGDVWMDYVAVFIANRFFKNKTEFVNRHVIFKRFSRYPNQVERYLAEDVLEQYRNKILVDIHYIKPAVSNDVFVNVKYDKALYKDVNKTRWNIYKNRPVRNIAELCFVLRKVINSDPSRGLAVETIVHEKKKVIIFYQYDYELEILKALSYGRGVKIAEWNGHKHESIPKSNRWVYLVQYTAGAEGWNCVETDTIIFYSQQYSYKTKVQAAGRIDRRNTPFKELYYYHLMSRSPIDLAIKRALNNKKDFNEKRFIKK